METTDTRGKILSAAAYVFAEKGLTAKVDEISKLAGVAKGTIYTYFKSKEELLFSAIENLIEKEKERFSRIASFPELMELFKEAVLPQVSRMNSYFKLVSSAVHLASISEEYREKIRELEEAERKAVEDVLVRTGIKISPEKMGGFILLLRGFFLNAVLSVSDVKEEEAEEAVNILFRGLEEGGSDDEE